MQSAKGAIISDPASGMYRIANIYFNPGNNYLIVEYELPRGRDIAIIPLQVSSTLEGVNVTRIRFAAIGAGVAGSIAAAIPAGATLLVDGGGQFGGLSGVVCEISGGEPTWEPIVIGGEVVTVTGLLPNGAYTLSADPGGACGFVFADREPVTTAMAGAVVESILAGPAGSILVGSPLPVGLAEGDVFLLTTDDGLYVAIDE